MIKTWRNGASGGEVKNVIDHNFNVVSKYLSKDVRALSTMERELLSSDYLSENTLVFDTDDGQWYKYSNGSWVKAFVNNAGNGVAYTQNISVNDWAGNTINILFEQHGVENPVVQLLIESGGSFIPVLGGVEVDSTNNVTLLTDLPFDGRVVIK